MLTGFNEGRIIIDRYLEQSLKNKMRQKRAVTSTEYKVHPKMKLFSMPLQELLSSSKTKAACQHIFIFQRARLHISKTMLVVAYYTKIRGRDFEEVHTHEEADTLIPNHTSTGTQQQNILVVNYVFHPLTQMSSFFL